MYYKDDRDYTDRCHKYIAVPIIYPQMKWVEKETDKVLLEYYDCNYAIDYIVVDTESNKEILLQERFRQPTYKTYSDFTFRYERRENHDSNKWESEFYKMQKTIDEFANPFYFLYAFENGNNCDKYLIVDIRIILDLFRENKIVVDKSLSKVGKVINNVLHVPVNYNPDGSSTFLPIEFSFINDIAPNAIIMQKGFVY